MVHTLNGLIKLQKIDSRLLEIEEIKGDLPDKVNNNEKSIDSLNVAIEENKLRIKEIGKELRLLTSQSEDYGSKLKKSKEQLYLVSSNKEYDAIMLEIDHMKNFLNNVENEIISLEEEKEKLEVKIKENDIDINNNKEELELNKLELEEAISETKNEENDLDNQRIVIIKSLKENHLNDYEKLRTSREGVAISPISRGACGGCFNLLPPQVYAEIKKHNDLIQCPSCNRYLYWEEELQD